MKKPRMEQYRDAAREWPGNIWRPDFQVRFEAPEHGKGGFYWRDNNSQDAPRGPFKAERNAWANLCAFFGIAPKAKPPACAYDFSAIPNTEKNRAILRDLSKHLNRARHSRMRVRTTGGDRKGKRDVSLKDAKLLRVYLDNREPSQVWKMKYEREEARAQLALSERQHAESEEGLRRALAEEGKLIGEKAVLEGAINTACEQRDEAHRDRNAARADLNRQRERDAALCAALSLALVRGHSGDERADLQVIASYLIKGRA